MHRRIVLVLTMAFVRMLIVAGTSQTVWAQEATPDRSATPAPSATNGRFTGFVDIGGRSLWLSCLGEGSPTVILESGSPFMGAGDWFGVQSRVAEVTHVCAYDRANAGSSKAAAKPRSVQQMADDLHALLAASGIPGPYVLAATSFGPLVTRMYASTYPQDVAGLVFIDPVPVELEARWKAVLPAALSARWITDFWGDNPEGIDFAASQVQLRAARPLPAVPFLVLVHDDGSLDQFFLPAGWPIAVLDPIWKELVADQAQEVPGGRLMVVTGAGHGMVFTAPEVVADAVGEVVAAVRDPGLWLATPAP